MQHKAAMLLHASRACTEPWTLLFTMVSTGTVGVAAVASTLPPTICISSLVGARVSSVPAATLSSCR